MKIDPKVHPIPADHDDQDAQSSRFKMPYVYRQYGIHKIGTAQYRWFENPNLTAEDVKFAWGGTDVSGASKEWEPVWRTVSEATIL